MGYNYVYCIYQIRQTGTNPSGKQISNSVGYVIVHEYLSYHLKNLQDNYFHYHEVNANERKMFLEQFDRIRRYSRGI